MTSLRLRTCVALGLTALAAIATSSVATPASAMGKPVLKVAYKASGSTLIKSTGSKVVLPASTLTTSLDGQGNFTGTLPLKATTASFSLLGLLPVKATVRFIATAPTTGKLSANPLPRVTATARYRINLADVTVGGLPAFVGTTCTTVEPVVITVATPKGKSFDVTKGGAISGSYTIGDFAGCGLTTVLVNKLIPGAGNTVTFTLSGGRTIK